MQSFRRRYLRISPARDRQEPGEPRIDSCLDSQFRRRHRFCSVTARIRNFIPGPAPSGLNASRFGGDGLGGNGFDGGNRRPLRPLQPPPGSFSSSVPGGNPPRIIPGLIFPGVPGGNFTPFSAFPDQLTHLDTFELDSPTFSSAINPNRNAAASPGRVRMAKKRPLHRNAENSIKI